MKIKIFILTVIGFIQIYAFKRWINCWRFSNEFYFTRQNLSDTLLNATNSEKGLPLILIRAMHNKITTFLWGSMQTLLQFWDIRFLSEFIGIIGAIGVLLAFCYLIKKGKSWWWVLVPGIVILSFAELFITPNMQYFERIIPLSVVFMILSLFGFWNFMEGKEKWIRLGIVVSLLIVSIVSLWLIPSAFFQFCLKI